jgi:hypothetical protein
MLDKKFRERLARKFLIPVFLEKPLTGALKGVAFRSRQAAKAVL